MIQTRRCWGSACFSMPLFRAVAGCGADGALRLGSGLGVQGTPGKVACSSCHDPSAGFVDTRSTKQQVSLGAAWTHRRSPSLLDVGYASVLMWDGRRDAGYNQVFGAIEASAEMNSSRLFVAQQMGRLYKADYERVFKESFPDLSDYAAALAAGRRLQRRTGHADRRLSQAPR